MGAMPLEYTMRSTSRELVNAASLEAEIGDWRSTGKGEINLAALKE
jgi:hypothetical protein